MENILELLIQQLQDEKLSLENLQDEYFDHQQTKDRVMEEMSRRPKYNNFLQMEKVLLSNKYEVAKMIEAIHNLKKKTESMIYNLKKEIKTFQRTTNHISSCLKGEDEWFFFVSCINIYAFFCYLICM